MNYRKVLLAGIISALMGTVFGWGLGEIAMRQRESQMRTYISQPFRKLYTRRLIFITTFMGFMVGSGEACVLGQKQLHKRD